MNNQQPVQINININIVLGDMTGSAIIQGGDSNRVNLSSEGVSAELLAALLLKK